MADKNKKGEIREWVEAVIIAALLAIFFRTFFFQIYKIPTSSMAPTLMVGDKIFVTKLVYGPKIPFTDARIKGVGELQRGDVVVFIPPAEEDKIFFKRKIYIKRVVGLEGETVEIKEGNVYINDKIVTMPQIAKNHYLSLGRYGKGEIAVPQNSYYLLGDNSPNSADSRFWGFIDESDVIGKAIFIWWPPKRIGPIE
jgi:signal peptidase I